MRILRQVRVYDCHDNWKVSDLKLDGARMNQLPRTVEIECLTHVIRISIDIAPFQKKKINNNEDYGGRGS